MARIATVYEVLIASPNDVEERDGIRAAVYDWNAAHSRYFGAILLPVMWEHNAAPEMGDRPQAIISRQIVADADILVGVFWTRLGTPTGKADSGTAEEIEEFVQAGKRVMLYFCERQPKLESIDTQQLEAVRAYQAECESKGICWRYQSPADLFRQLSSHLMQAVRVLSSTLPQSTNLAGNQSELARLCIDFKAYTRKLAARWNAEVREGVRTVGDIQYMLETAYFDLLDLAARVDPDLWPAASGLADGALEETRALAYGGGSAAADSPEYAAYMDRVSALLTCLSQIPAALGGEPSA